MKKKLSLLVAISAIALGLGAAVGVGANGLKEAKATDGEPVGFYLVGSGSFVSGTAWTTGGGVQMKSKGDNHGALLTQYLETGDVFKLTDGNNVWSGWDQYKSGGSYFQSTGLDAENGKLKIEIQYEGDWWGNDNCVTRIITKGSTISEHNETIDLSNTYGTANIWSDCKSIEFCRHNKDGDYNTLGGETYFPTDFTKQYYYKIDAWNWQDAHLNRYDKTSDLNIMVQETGYYDIYLNSGNDIYIGDSIQDWIGDYMHMDDYDKGGSAGSTSGTGLCYDYYGTAKEHLLAMGSGAVSYFSTNHGNKYTTALARYNEWARINKDASPFEASASNSRGIASNVIEPTFNSTGLIILVVAGAIVLAGGYFLIRRARKED